MDNVENSRPPGRDAVEGMGISEFARGIAHEIANPFTAIAMNAEMVKYLVERNETQRASEVLDQLMADCERCSHLVQGMQRFGSGLRRQEMVDVELSELIDGAIALAQDEITGKRPSMKLTVGADELRTRADVPSMQRALAGLLQNSAEAGATSVKISVHRDGAHLVIEVEDDGAGIADDIRERVADAFFSTRRPSGCCGLGLTLMREMLQRHDGSMHIAADRAGGALISVRLPICSSSSVERAVARGVA